jgi:UDP-N-acetyl-D-mannosaminuronic acid transferase (WecB/TagA/CpsF family)
VQRAPMFFQKTGLEWLYRLATQPARARRILFALPFYGLLATMEAIEIRLGFRRN